MTGAATPFFLQSITIGYSGGPRFRCGKASPLLDNGSKAVGISENVYVHLSKVDGPIADTFR